MGLFNGRRRAKNRIYEAASSRVVNFTRKYLHSISNAHKEWDGTIAIAEGEQNQESFNFDKSQLDQQILNCQNYGQQ